MAILAGSASPRWAEGDDVVPCRTVRLSSEQNVNLLQGDGDADASQHGVHHHRRDRQRCATQLAEPEEICSNPAQTVIAQVTAQPNSATNPRRSPSTGSRGHLQR